MGSNLEAVKKIIKSFGIELSITPDNVRFLETIPDGCNVTHMRMLINLHHRGVPKSYISKFLNNSEQLVKLCNMDKYELMVYVYEEILNDGGSDIELRAHDIYKASSLGVSREIIDFLNTTPKPHDTNYIGMIASLEKAGVPKRILDSMVAGVPGTAPQIINLYSMTHAELLSYIRNTNNMNRNNDLDTDGDVRYNNPKKNHGVDQVTIDDAIENNDIYKEVREAMLNAQRKQVGYGLSKYPETLNANSWTTVETLDHIIEESVDRLHYLVMLKNQLLSRKHDV